MLGGARARPVCSPTSSAAASNGEAIGAGTVKCVEAPNMQLIHHPMTGVRILQELVVSIGICSAQPRARYT